MHRIKKLRKVALENKICYEEFYYKFYKCYNDSIKVSKEERYAEAFYFALSNLTPCISDDELIVGKCNKKLSPADECEWLNTYLPITLEESKKAGGGQDSHMAIDYELVLNCGLKGIIEKINIYLLNCDESKKKFYNICKKCLEAVINFSEQYANEAARLAESSTDSNRREELKKISEMCRKVPANPDESF